MGTKQATQGFGHLDMSDTDGSVAPVPSVRKHPLTDCDNCTLKNEPFVPESAPSESEILLSEKSQSGKGAGEIRRLSAVGIAPSHEEVKQGRPFCGPSGKLLRAVLAERGIDPASVHLTNVVACKTPKNRDPSKAEIACCAPRLDYELADKTHIIALGAIATKAVLGGAAAITKARVGPPKKSKRFPNAEVIPTFHPAACLRSADSFPHLVNDIGKLCSTVRLGWEPPTYTVIDRSDDVPRLVDELWPYRDRLVFDIETAYEKDNAFEHPSQIPLLAIGIAYAPGKVVVLGEEALKDKSRLVRLGSLLENSNLTAHNGKFDLQGTTRFGPNASLAYDTLLASYAHDERGGIHSLEYVGIERLGTPKWKTLEGSYGSLAKAPRAELYAYNANDCQVTWLAEDYYRKTHDAQSKRLTEFLVRTANALVPVELEGIGVDCEELSRLMVVYAEKLEVMEKELQRWAVPNKKGKMGLNPRSWQQVMQAFESFYSIKLDSTDKEHLETLIAHQRTPAEARAFAKKLLEYKGEHKLFSTYIAGASKRLHNGRLFPTILLHGTVTGRPSCRNPNLFNIPRGSAIRNLYVPAEGNVFIQCDYSQIELRVLACLAKEPYLRDIFCDPARDIHSEIAARLGITRQHAKVIVYGLAYGMEAPLLAAEIGQPIAKARRYMREFFDVIPEVARWKKELEHKILHEQEDLETPYGRRRRLWLITEENKRDIIKEGTAFYPQSIASDICVTALVKLLERGFACRLSVYDSILVECLPDDAEAVSREMNEVMTEAGREFSDYVPFVTDTKVGISWGAL